ncbi:hypothetical protein ACFPVT_00100 [Corynebacterium choanae]|uniref:2'-5' RNA ligase family protein n=1 Tax=Corynebacterium choanae TaxID=1862358 RepID=A0A3G6J5G5_9CORY|nr:hypothetical protein [Corynebacterium choanae]AZA13112.1 hypothetical protein CCHOA_03505 [Corynebacterium choanae]
MQRFFGTPSTEWDHLDGQLHVYHVPAADSPLSRAMADTAAQLAAIDSIAIQPVPYFHATIQLLDWNLHTVSQSQVDTLIDTLHQATATVAALDLTFAAPVIRPYAVETVATVTRQWDQLVTTVRNACTAVGCVLPAAPYGAHMSLAYGIAEGPDSAIDQAMTPSGFPVSHTIDDLHLVSVTQNRAAGVFEFDQLARFTLRK